jgi:C4-dicarboxylate transporter/malic acid transport protein
MGTGGVTIVLLMAASSTSFIWPIATIFLVITLSLFLILFFIFIIRSFSHPSNVKEELFHPIKSNFFPMLPISLIVIGISLHKINTGILQSSLLTDFTHGLLWIGTLGIFLFGWGIVTVIFIQSKITIEDANYGWFIPPVSHLIIPVLGLSLISPGYSQEYTSLLFFVSLIAFGIGFFLFLFVGSLVYHRYTSHRLPVSKLAPTFFIGIAPTSIITITFIKLANLPTFAHHGISLELFSQLSPVFAIISWGFSFWWMVLSIIMLIYYVSQKTIHFTVSFWAYIFPFATFAVATGVINQQVHYSFFSAMFTISTGILLVMWGIVALQTFRYLLRRHYYIKSFSR